MDRCPLGSASAGGLYSGAVHTRRETALETSATRLWKRLSREERIGAARHFFQEPPQELLGSALGAIIKVRKLRPQVARTLPPDEQARILAGVSDPGEPLAASLLVALHLGERRAMLSTFLDAVGLPHQDGLLKDDDASTPLSEDSARKGVAALAAAFPGPWVELYMNALWMQDPERWAVLERSPDWL